MSIRSTVGAKLESVLGRDRIKSLRRAERRYRNALARRIAMDPPKRVTRNSRSVVAGERPAEASKKAPKPNQPNQPDKLAKTAPASRWRPSDPFVPHPRATVTRHALLQGLHERLRPRTYLEIGINDGASLMLSRTRSIGVDPAFRVNKPIHCDVQLVRATSDDFFAGPDLLAHFDGVPVDLAFIDGMHLAEFALRDFINVERLMADTGVIVLDDVLPRNGLEAARNRCTQFWAGDVYKAVEIVRRRRPDLAVVLVNTFPTGTAVVAGADRLSEVLANAYPDEESYLQRADPQCPPQEFMDRSIAVDPAVLLECGVWEELASRRDRGEQRSLDDLLSRLRDLPPA